MSVQHNSGPEEIKEDLGNFQEYVSRKLIGWVEDTNENRLMKTFEFSTLKKLLDFVKAALELSAELMIVPTLTVKPRYVKVELERGVRQESVMMYCQILDRTYQKLI